MSYAKNMIIMEGWFTISEFGRRARITVRWAKDCLSENMVNQFFPLSKRQWQWVGK